MHHIALRGTLSINASPDPCNAALDPAHDQHRADAASMSCAIQIVEPTTGFRIAARRQQLNSCTPRLTPALRISSGRWCVTPNEPIARRDPPRHRLGEAGPVWDSTSNTCLTNTTPRTRVQLPHRLRELARARSAAESPLAPHQRDSRRVAARSTGVRSVSAGHGDVVGSCPGLPRHQ